MLVLADFCLYFLQELLLPGGEVLVREGGHVLPEVVLLDGQDLLQIVSEGVVHRVEVFLVIFKFLPELLEGLEVLGPPAQLYVLDHVLGLVLTNDCYKVVQGCDLLSECLLFVLLFLLEESGAHEAGGVGHVL